MEAHLKKLLLNTVITLISQNLIIFTDETMVICLPYTQLNRL